MTTTTKRYGGMNGCQAIDAIVADHGHAEPIRHLATNLESTNRSSGQAERIAEVVGLLRRAAEMLESEA
jgi:hypothetical protein